jgi:hypothetical protein
MAFGVELITNGPKVPENLLEAHAEGRVVFFCGAGISCWAGLPLFDVLVEKVGLAADDFELPEHMNINSSEYDLILNLLSQHIGRSKFIRTIWKILEPNYTLSSAVDFHEALLKLSKNTEGQSRLVTTNVDRIFEYCIDKAMIDPRPEALVAPRPPIPKDHYWNGLVYLHGLLPKTDYSEGDEEDNLVFTTADFGRAYLSERWASRFVTEMLRNYVVCFVGYSANDPVMRYIIDAMANDERVGVRLPSRYIFTDSEVATDHWTSRGLIPIRYKRTCPEVPCGADDCRDHHLLRDTFIKWAEDYSFDFGGKRAIAKNVNTISPPTAPSDGDNHFREQHHYSRLMWALRDIDVLREFVMINPRPDWNWIHLLISDEFNFEDLESFGHDILPIDKPDLFREFSLIQRMVKFEDATNQTLSGCIYYAKPTSDPIHLLHRWVCRHLENPKVAIWLAKQPNILSENLKFAIDQELEVKDRVPSNNKDEHLEKENFDPEISDVMRQVWSYFLNNNVLIKNTIMYPWFAWLEEYGTLGRLTVNLKLTLRDLIKPKLRLEDIISIKGEKIPTPEEANYIGDIFWTNLDISIDHGARELVELTLGKDISADDIQYYFSLFESSLTELFDFWSEVDGKYRYELLINNYILNLKDDSSQVHEWLHIANGLYLLLVKILKQNTAFVEEVILRWIDSPHPYFRAMALRTLSENDQFETELIFEILALKDGEVFVDSATARYASEIMQKYNKSLSSDQINKLMQYILDQHDEESDT